MSQETESLEWRSVKEALAGFSAEEVRSALRRRPAVVAYTDGACIKNPGGPAGWSAILVPVERLDLPLTELPAERIEAHGHIPPSVTTTNNRAEIAALLAALSLAPPDRPLKIWSDSQYTIKVATGDYKARMNPDLWQLFRWLANHRTAPLSFSWVRGHAGQALNERADELAGLGAWQDDRAAYEQWLRSQQPEARSGARFEADPRRSGRETADEVRPSASELALMRDQVQELLTLLESGRIALRDNERQFLYNMAQRLRYPDFAPTAGQRNWLKGLSARARRML
ncbi:RNase H family protein [Thermogemmatispora onikobensis]|uniref:RNase H family protein n=1 Tax=Thermogemmatispora onikobensis TaxID=732234 RepID=UPI0008537977|nr:RNase H family protein [Thermogemmatispora onikobensis]